MAVALKCSSLGLSIPGYVLVVPLGPVSPQEPKAAGIMLPHSSQSPPIFPKTLAGCCISTPSLFPTTVLPCSCPICLLLGPQNTGSGSASEHTFSSGATQIISSGSTTANPFKGGKARQETTFTILKLNNYHLGCWKAFPPF